MAQYEFDRSLDLRTWDSLDSFTQGYIECAMWLLTDENGESLSHLGLHDIAQETIQAVIDDCRQFQEAHGPLLERAEAESGRTASHHGHDYFLTRNGHGAGFWDRGYSADLGEALTQAAKAEGTDDWYVGDDGNVYKG